MNHRQTVVQQAQLNEEKKTIRELKQVYGQAKKDCEAKIRELASRTDMENLQTIIYQKQYQEALKKQLDGVLDNLQSKQFTTVADYLMGSYENGFFGTLYDLQGQGIPLIFPFDQKQAVLAIQTNSKLSKSLYDKMGENVDHLKKSIRAELSRGVSNGSSWMDVAGRIARGMNSPYDKALNRTIVIARTEGHRIQQQATLDCQHKAKDKGADVLKQWDATLDRKTRPWHAEADGQTVELDEYFSVGGEKMSAPGVGGTARNVCNCRCCLVQRARWALSDMDYTKMNGDTGELVKLKESDYTKFKEKAKETIRIQECANGWKGLNYQQNYNSKKEAVTALKENYSISFSDSRKYPIDDKLLCDMVSWMDSFKNEYPDFVSGNPVKIPKIACKAPSYMKNAVGMFTYYADSMVPVDIALNGMYHADGEFFKEYVDRCIKSKWTVANATVHKTFVHEYGHYVSNTMTKISGQSKWENGFLQDVIAEYEKMHPEHKNQVFGHIGDILSEYGGSSYSEMFAEAFAEYFGGEKPRDFAKIFGTKLDGVLKGVK